MPPWLTSLFLALPATALAERPPGQPVDPSLAIDVTRDGFAAISDTLPAFVPTDLAIPDIKQSGSLAFRWTLDVTGLDVDVRLNDVAVVPAAGYLQIDADVTVAVNESSKPAGILFKYYTPSWLGGPWTIADCDFYVKPIQIDAATRAYLKVVPGPDGKRVLDATISRVDWDWSFTGTDIQVSNCWIGSINDILEYIDFSLFDLVKGPLESLIDGQVQSLVAGLEPTLEEAFNSFALDETFDLNGAQLRVSLEPSDVVVVPDGMRLTTAGLAEATEHPCVAGGPTGSKETAGDLPPIGSAPNGIGAYEVGIMGSDDFLNQVLFAAYRGGGLCYTLSGEQGDLPINTALLGLLAPGAFDALFPEAKPMVIEVRPARPPEAVPGVDHDIQVVANDLGLDLYAELDGRQALIVGLDLDIDAGADLNFDGSTGKLGLAVDLSGDDLTASVRTNELAPGTDDAIAAQVGSLFDTLAAPILGDALSGLSFDIPSFGGFGLTSLDAAPAGPSKDFFGFYAGAGQVPYGDGGCGGGCGDTASEGCDQGCSASGAGRTATLLAFPLLVALLRRRRSTTR